MDNRLSPAASPVITCPSFTSVVRLLPLSLLFFLTTPHNLAEQIHSIYTQRPYLKPSPRDPFPSKAGDIDLDVLSIPLDAPSYRTNIVLQPGTSLYTSLRAPSVCTEHHSCSALLETWYDSKLPREFKPDPYFLAANHEVPQPFPAYPRYRIADDEAFLVWRPYHFLRIPRISTKDQWHIRILNHDSTVFNVLNATLRVTIVEQSMITNAPHKTSTSATAFSDATISANTSGARFASNPKTALCPSGPAGYPCSAQGRCTRDGSCVCLEGWGGHYCETRILDLPNEAIDVPPDVMRIFRYVAPRSASITTMLELLSPPSVTAAAHPLLFAKRPGANGGNKLLKGPPLPTIYDLAFTDSAAIQQFLSVQNVVTPDVRKGETVLIGVYNFHPTTPAWLIRRHRNLRTTNFLSRRRVVRVRVHSYACVEHDDPLINPPTVRGTQADMLPFCPLPSARYWDLGMRSVLFPIMVGVVILMTLLVCVTVWAGVFRQHMLDSIVGIMNARPPGHVQESMRHRDKLSEAEVCAMFPAFQFTKGETDALCAAGDDSCSVCLYTFEEGEMLRRLACGHSYHSGCLDRWLLTNASCPRCRKAARIKGELFRTDASLQRTLRFVFYRLAALCLWIRSICIVTLGGRRGQERIEEGNSPFDQGSNGNNNYVAIRVMRMEGIV